MTAAECVSSCSPLDRHRGRAIPKRKGAFRAFRRPRTGRRAPRHQRTVRRTLRCAGSVRGPLTVADPGSERADPESHPACRREALVRLSPAASRIARPQSDILPRRRVVYAISIPSMSASSNGSCTALREPARIKAGGALPFANLVLSARQFVKFFEQGNVTGASRALHCSE